MYLRAIARVTSASDEACCLGSADGVSWEALPEVTKELKAKIQEFEAHLRAGGKVFEPLLGNPTHMYKYNITVPPAEVGCQVPS